MGDLIMFPRAVTLGHSNKYTLVVRSRPHFQGGTRNASRNLINAARLDTFAWAFEPIGRYRGVVTDLFCLLLGQALVDTKYKGAFTKKMTRLWASLVPMGSSASNVEAS